MVTNKIAHLFIIHIVNNLDDTVISKKKILSDVLVMIDDLKSDECFVKLFMGIFCPDSKRYFSEEELEAFSCLKEHSTSKKDADQRHQEILSIVTKPIETFFEENMLYYLLDTRKNHLLPRVLGARIELGSIKESDCMDEMLRQIQKKHHYDGKSQMLIGHPDLHRNIKDLVKQDATQKDSKLDFCSQIASIISKNFLECIETRAVWIIVELLENENTAKLIKPEVAKNKDALKALVKKGKGTKGVEVILKALTKK